VDFLFFCMFNILNFFFFYFFFFFNDTATTEIYTTRHTLSLHDALPILSGPRAFLAVAIPIALPLLVATVSLQPSASPATTNASILTPSILTPKLSYSELTAAPTATLPAHAEVLTIEDGDTLDSVLV